MSQAVETGDSVAEATPANEFFCYRALGSSEVARLAEKFRTAEPFSHIVIDDFLTLPPSVVFDAFPDHEWQHWERFNDAYQHQKMACNKLEMLPSLFKAMVHQLSSPSFLEFLQNVTGIHGLIPDPYLTGGGLHSSGPGGILAPHADFHSNRKLSLFRRINVLIYFNPDWQETFGGCLELFAKGANVPTRSVVPTYGRMVMFLTDDRSVHGFTRPIAGTNNWRNSLALYYYTSEDTSRFSGDGTTYWQAHGRQPDMRARINLLAYRALLGSAWRLSMWAHRLNPNFRQGAGPISAAVGNQDE